jgi:hypothetical protein
MIKDLPNGDKLLHIDAATTRFLTRKQVQTLVEWEHEMLLNLSHRIKSIPVPKPGEYEVIYSKLVLTYSQSLLNGAIEEAYVPA